MHLASSLAAAAAFPRPEKLAAFADHLPQEWIARAVLAEKSVRASPEPASCARLRHLPLVSVVKSSHLGELDHLPQLRPLDTPRLRGIAGE